MGTTLSGSVKVPTLGCVPVPGSRTESLNTPPLVPPTGGETGGGAAWIVPTDNFDEANFTPEMGVYGGLYCLPPPYGDGG